jgi:hypothetical protein
MKIAVVAALIKLRLPPLRVHNPVFTDPALLILVELFAAVTSAALGTDDLHDQVRRAFQQVVFHPRQVGRRNEHNIRRASRTVRTYLHLKRVVK